MGEGEGEDNCDEPEVLRLIGTVHPNIRSRAPQNHYDEDQLRIEALETIPTNVPNLEQRDSWRSTVMCRSRRKGTGN